MRDNILLFCTTILCMVVSSSYYLSLHSQHQKEEVYAYMCDNNASNISLDYARFCVERKYKFERKQNEN